MHHTVSAILGAGHVKSARHLSSAGNTYIGCESCVYVYLSKRAILLERHFALSNHNTRSGEHAHPPTRAAFSYMERPNHVYSCTLFRIFDLFLGYFGDLFPKYNLSFLGCIIDEIPKRSKILSVNRHWDHQCSLGSKLGKEVTYLFREVSI